MKLLWTPPMLLVASVFSVGTPAQQAPAAVPTYSRDVAPILYKHCTDCHRPGEIAPMSLMTYGDAFMWAQAIRDEVGAGHMPPWHADPAHGTFRNARDLSAAERDILTRWANAGAPRGNPADAPKPPAYAEGWRIGTPDVVFEMPKPYAVKRNGMIDYQYFEIPTNFTEDKFVRAVEVRPGNREVVHHALVYVRVPEGGPRPRRPFTQPREQQETPDPPRQSAENMPTGPMHGLLATFAPGTGPIALPAGAAIRVRAGTTLVLQMHYTTMGADTTDRTRVGLIFSDTPPTDEIRPTHFMHGGLFIPAGAKDHPVTTEVTFTDDTKVWAIFPHTHLRGKRWQYEAVYPDGRREVVLSVPRYDFNWQTYYEFTTPLVLPRGTRLIATAHYDNSAGNPNNPDPKVDVRWGEQTWEEMQYTGLLISFVHPTLPAGGGG